MRRINVARHGGRRAFGFLVAVRRWLRPSRLIGFAAAVVKIGALVAALSIAFLVLGAAVSQLYDQYGFHPQENARTWAGLTPAYADSAICQNCHAAAYVSWTASKHSGVVCESCHGPLGAHASTGTVGAVRVSGPTGQVCAACHARVVGRPATFPQVDLAAHYARASCLQCHNAHSAVATAPPPVSHPLANLPECTACHGPQGLRAMPVGHQVSSDGICLSCHTPTLSGQ